MLGFTPNPSKQGKKINLAKLKEEINALSGELKFLKGRVRDPDLNLAIYRWACKGDKFNDKTKEFTAAQIRRYKTRLRFNKLIVLRSLMRNKVHFHKNTRFEEVDHALTKLKRFPTKEDLWDWVSDIRKEFEID